MLSFEVGNDTFPHIGVPFIVSGSSFGMTTFDTSAPLMITQNFDFSLFLTVLNNYLVFINVLIYP